MKRVLLFVVCVLSALNAAAGGLHQRVADNGLVILTKADHAAPVAHVRVFVLTGSMTEGRWMGYGISHLVEHLVAGGSTSTRTEQESNAIVESIGNQMNAYTTKDHTAYHLTTTSDQVGTAIDLLADWLTRAALTSDEYERERGVVTREIEKGLSEPGRVLYNLLMETMFLVHPVRFPTIGYLPVFETITHDDVRQYYYERYAPNNMVAVAVGDFDPIAVADEIERAFSHAPRRTLPVEALPVEPPQLGPRYRETHMDVESAYVMMAFRTVQLAHPDLYPLDVLSHILSNGDSSRLVRKLRDELGLATSVSSFSYTPGYDAGLFGISLELRAENIDAATAAVLAELERTQRERVSADELRRAKRQKQAELVFGNQTAEQQASALGSNWFSAGNPEFDRLYVDNIQRVTAAELQDAARRYFRDENRTVVAVLPKRVARAAASATATTPLSATAKPRLHRLDNGVRVLHLHNPAVPLVEVYGALAAGVAYESADQAGITDIMGRMLTRGAGKWDAQQIARFFDGVGGSIGAQAGYNSLGVSMSVLAADLETAMPYYAAVLTQPTFPAGELETIRTQALAQLDRMDDDWTTEAMRLFRRAFFGDGPYRNTPQGTREAVQRLGRDDLAAWHRAVVHPDNLVLAIYGDIDEARALELARRHLGGWRTAAPLALPPLPETAPPATGQTARKQTEKQVAAIYMGYPGMRVGDVADRDAMTILDAVLSGLYYPGGRLHAELRGQQLVYVVHAFNVPGVLPGFFGIYAGTQPEKADEVVARITAQIERLKAEPITAEELEQAKRMALASEALSNQTNAQLAQRAALDELYGLGYAAADNYAQRINAVTAADVQAVANKYLTQPTVAIASPAVR